jgi:hypothetical protein
MGKTVSLVPETGTWSEAEVLDLARFLQAYRMAKVESFSNFLSLIEVPEVSSVFETLVSDLDEQGFLDMKIRIQSSESDPAIECIFPEAPNHLFSCILND